MKHKTKIKTALYKKLYSYKLYKLYSCSVRMFGALNDGNEFSGR